jgi:hypothetical protein
VVFEHVQGHSESCGNANADYVLIAEWWWNLANAAVRVVFEHSGHSSVLTRIDREYWVE